MRRVVGAVLGVGVLTVLTGAGVGLYPNPYGNDGHSKLFCGAGFRGPGYSAEFNPGCTGEREEMRRTAWQLIGAGAAVAAGAPVLLLIRRSGGRRPAGGPRSDGTSTGDPHPAG
ncbi:hypothetical protein [Kitasatospora sp. NPDC088346]|uniref:hypothetical protein n=1 Tax=Kitasatospora sp. NPDC088346 TaxID=3364073 RepID=UPI003812AFA0